MCDLSKSCTDILKISLDDDFIKEFLGALSVTNSYDAQRALNSKLKDIQDGLHLKQNILNNKESSNANISLAPKDKDLCNEQAPTVLEEAREKTLTLVDETTRKSPKSKKNSLMVEDKTTFGFEIENNPCCYTQPSKRVKINDTGDKEVCMSQPIMKLKEDFWSGEGILQCFHKNSQQQPSQSIFQNEDDGFDFW